MVSLGVAGMVRSCGNGGGITDTKGLRWDKNGGQTHCLRQYNEQVEYEQSKSNLESNYLIVQFIYEYNRVKGILYIVTWWRDGHRVCTEGE